MAVQKHYIYHAGEDAALVATATKTAAYSAAYGDLVPVNTAGGSVTVTLPAADMRGMVGVQLLSGTAQVTVDGYGSETVDGAASAAVSIPGEVRVFVSDGSGAWHTCAGGPTLAGLRIAAETGTVNTVAASGAAQTIPEPSTYTYNDVTLTADCTLTFPAATLGKKLRMVFRQDGTGGWDLTWPAGSKTVGGTLQVSQAAGAIDVIEAISVVEDEWLIYRVGAALA